MNGKTVVRNDLFDRSEGLDRGRSRFCEIVWYLTKMTFFLTSFPWPSTLKVWILRTFGAKVGKGTVIKPRVNILFPWKLQIGDHVWIGEEAWLLNFEALSIGSHACISQRAFLCGGNHDFRSRSMKYRNGPIAIEEGAWVGAQAFVSAGVRVGMDAVVCAGAVVTRSLPSGMICSGNPCVPIKKRWQRAE